MFYGSHRFVIMLASPYRSTDLKRAFAHPSVNAVVPTWIALLRHLGIVYVHRKQLGWIKTVLLPDMQQEGICVKTMRMATTYKRA